TMIVGLAKSPAAQVKLKQIAAALILLTLFLPHGIATELQLRKSNMVFTFRRGSRPVSPNTTWASAKSARRTTADRMAAHRRLDRHQHNKDRKRKERPQRW